MSKEISGSYSVQQAARAMQCSLKWIYDLVLSGQIRAKKVDGRWRIPKAEVEERIRKRGDNEQRSPFTSYSS